MIRIDLEILTSSLLRYFGPLGDDYYHYNYRYNQTLRSSIFFEIPEQAHRHMLRNLVETYFSKSLDYVEFLTRHKDNIQEDFSLATVEDTDYFIKYLLSVIINVDSEIVVDILIDLDIRDIVKSPGHICIASFIQYLITLKKDPNIEFVGSSGYKWF